MKGCVGNYSCRAGTADRAVFVLVACKCGARQLCRDVGQQTRELKVCMGKRRMFGNHYL